MSNTSRASAIESMTGYGEARTDFEGTPAVCRVKSLNHRFLDLKVRLPRPDLTTLDLAIRRQVGELFKRGAIELTLTVETSGAGTDMAFNAAIAKSYLQGAKKLASQLKMKDKLSLDVLLRLPGVVSQSGSGSPAIDDLLSEVGEDEIIARLVAPALRSLREARLREGERLSKHLLQLADQMDAHYAGICRMEQPEKEKARAALVQRATETAAFLSSVAGQSQPLSEEFTKRLREEAVFWIERRDYEEERVRLGIHLKELRELVGQAAGNPDGVGRKLEFLQQELLREVNTLGTKAQSTDVTAHTIELKTILERIKEQLANVA